MGWLAHDSSHSFPPISPVLASCQTHTYHILTQILLQPSPAQYGSHPSVNDMKYIIPGRDSLPSMAKYSTVPRTSPHATSDEESEPAVLLSWHPWEGYTVSLIKPYNWLAGGTRHSSIEGFWLASTALDSRIRAEEGKASNQTHQPITTDRISYGETHKNKNSTRAPSPHGKQRKRCMPLNPLIFLRDKNTALSQAIFLFSPENLS
jgi:hypothetical protein